MPQIEVTEASSIVGELGRPQNFGWAKLPFFTFDRGLLTAPRRRMGESDRYVLMSPSHTVVFEILDDGYQGYMWASVISFKDKKRSTHVLRTPFSLGSFNMPSDSEAGSIKLKHRKDFLNFAVMDKGIRIIKVDIPKFSRGLSLRGEVVLIPPPDSQSLATNMPWRADAGAFCCSRRSPCYSVEGVIQLGTTELTFMRDSGWGIFDWNRGVRPRKDLRFWAAGSGLFAGRQTAFSVGHSSADSSHGTENAFFLDGALHKLDQVTFHLPSRRLAPWRFTSNDNRLEMTFTPKQERDENYQIFLYSLKRRQLFGSFSGRVTLDSGDEFEFRNIAGFAERRKSRL
ncbi:MAG: DUF2804 domain-containing protein [Treponema sp.]|nr:DUF2804 domain-containing protein [Treponema sp.]